MTGKQAEVWDLYKSGRTVTEIARATGRSKGNVSTMLKLIKARLEKPIMKSSVPCPYSASCFTCPLADCVMDGTMVNII